MLKLTQPDNRTIYFRADSILAIVPEPTGCHIYAFGVNGSVKESAMAVYQMVTRAEKRTERTKRSGTNAA